jgi:hypothetical protein
VTTAHVLFTSTALPTGLCRPHLLPVACCCRLDLLPVLPLPFPQLRIPFCLLRLQPGSPPLKRAQPSSVRFITCVRCISGQALWHQAVGCYANNTRHNQCEAKNNSTATAAWQVCHCCGLHSCMTCRDTGMPCQSSTHVKCTHRASCMASP